MAFCLIKSLADKFKKALKSGEIDPAKLSEMTSAERHKFFGDMLGEENAQHVNSLFESKLLLKDQQRGMITWAKSISGIKPEVRRDMVARIERMDKVLDAKSEKAFLEDLASSRLGVDINYAEAQKITELSNKLQEAKTKLKDDFTFETESERLDYGAKMMELNNYVADLKAEANKLTLGDLKTAEGVNKAVSNTAGFFKSVKASLDDSAILRQGWKSVFTDPKLWAKNALKTFSDFAKQVSKKANNNDIVNATDGEIQSRQNALNGNYKRMGLDVGVVEEAYPSSFVEKIPGVGRVFKASEVVYGTFLKRMRADIADKYLKIAEDGGINIKNAEQAKSIGNVVNSLTGRGNLGSLEKIGKEVNTVFFSPKNVKANFDTLTAHQFQKGVTPFARKLAAKNLLKIATGTAAVLGLASVAMPGSVDWDPKSSDFGKIRIGDTRFDVTGGMGSMVVLAARQLSGASKSSSTGIVSKLGSGDYGSQTRWDVLLDYFTGKLSPVASVMKQIMEGKDFSGNKTTPLGVITDLAAPLPITNAMEAMKNPNSAPLFLTIIADALGIGANTYSANANWENSTSKEMEQFKAKVGDKEFKTANDLYNQKLVEQIKLLKTDKKYQAMTPDEKKAELSRYKDAIKQAVFDKYNFKVKSEKKKTTKKLPIRIKL